MRDPLNWSFPLGRLFGITIKVHLLFPLVAVGLVMWAVFHKSAAPGIWADATMVVVLLFVTVLLHEYGHCVAAYQVGGEAQEILMWPLGGLRADVSVPALAVCGLSPGDLVRRIRGLLRCRRGSRLRHRGQ